MEEGEGRPPTEKVPLEKIDDYTWHIPKYKPGMRVPGVVFANRDLLEKTTPGTRMPGLYFGMCQV